MRNLIRMITTVLVTLAVATPATAFFSSDMDKAQDAFKKAEEYSAVAMQADAEHNYKNAIRFLRAVVVDDPTNSEAHELMGRVYLALGKRNEARASFLSASITSLRTSYALNQGALYVNPEDDNAESFYRATLRENPESAQKIKDDLFRLIKIDTEDGNLDRANGLANLMAKIDLASRTEVSDYFAGYGDRQSRANSLVYYQLAFDLLVDEDSEQSVDGERSETIGLKVLNASQLENGKRGETLKTVAGRMLGKSHTEYVKAYPPKSWKTVIKLEFTGKGLGEKDYIPTVQRQKEYDTGYKLFVTGDHFQVWSGGKWKSFRSGESYEQVVAEGSGNGFFYVKAPQGIKFWVEVQKFSI